jgi:site-specific recombinase XerC
MVTSPTIPPVSPLRQRMQQDMLMRGLGVHTQHDYVRHVRRFAAFLGQSPDVATADDIRRYQLFQHENGVNPSTINGAVSALRFLFDVTLKRRDLSRALVITRYQRQLPDVLSIEEAARLLEAAPSIKYKAALGVAYGAGLRVSEVAHLKVDDIDSARMLIRIEQGKGRKGSQCHALAPAAGAAATVVARRQAAGRDAAPWLAISGALPNRSDLVAAIASRGAGGGRGRRHPQTGQLAHLAAQLCHAPAGAGCRYPGYPDAARALQA